MRIISSWQIFMPPERQTRWGSLPLTWRRETAKLGTDSHYFPSFGEIETFLKENCRPGDLLLTMGAGDIVTVGEDLVK